MGVGRSQCTGSRSRCLPDVRGVMFGDALHDCVSEIAFVIPPPSGQLPGSGYHWNDILKAIEMDNPALVSRVRANMLIDESTCAEIKAAVYRTYGLKLSPPIQARMA